MTANGATLHEMATSADGKLNIVVGEVQINPLIFQTDKIDSTSKGKVNLDNEKIDIRFNTRTRGGIGLSAGTLITPFIKVGGSLSNPSIVLDPTDAAVKGGAAVATGGPTLIGQSLFDRFLRQRDPCGKVVTELHKIDDSVENQN